MQLSISQMKSLSVKRRIILSGVLGILIAGVTFFVSELVVVSFGHGDSGSALTLGFPLPYFTFVPCCQSFGPPYVALDNSYFFHPTGFIVDIAVWEAISFALVLGFSFRKLLISSASGLVLTVASLISPPIYLVAPTPALETSILKPMGFPYEYLTYYVGGLPGTISSGYQFDVVAAVADFALWFGITFVILGIVSRKQFRKTKRS